MSQPLYLQLHTNAQERISNMYKNDDLGSSNDQKSCQSPIKVNLKRQQSDRWYTDLKDRNPYGPLAPKRHSDIEPGPLEVNLDYDKNQADENERPFVKKRETTKGGEFAHFAERNPYGPLKPKRHSEIEPAPNYYANKLF